MSWVYKLAPVWVVLIALLGRHWYLTPSTKRGERPPAFEAILQDGSDFSLDELEGYYVLVDFWGSWCGPCRVANPDLRALWLSYKDASFSTASGFTIVSIGVEKNQASWARAIVQDRLDWKYHILDTGDDLRFFNSPLSELWGVNQVPTTFLIDPKGYVVGVNLSLSEIEEHLQQG